ncbi:MAG: WGR domain-containing protein [Chromatiales bacterium]|jgi:predicted DNA-binding WGR domain protein|nr:WGR domain-containing protein [Chromatiales bacterium]
MHIYLQISPGEDRPRFYHLILQADLLGGWSLVREWGAQGGSGRVVRDHHDSREAAETAMMRARDEQVKRGYRVVFVQGDHLSE